MTQSKQYCLLRFCFSNINRSSYYKWLKRTPSKRQLQNEQLAERINQKWLTDVTEFKYGNEEKAYLSAILDLCDKRIVSFVFGHRNNNEIVFHTFDIAMSENPGATPLFHSDRGFQYTSPAFKNKLAQAHMIQSMSRVGKCIDNGPMESFWGFLKTEMYYLRKFDTFEELKTAVEEYYITTTITVIKKNLVVYRQWNIIS